jgi:hypothetical protein
MKAWEATLLEDFTARLWEDLEPRLAPPDVLPMARLAAAVARELDGQEGPGRDLRRGAARVWRKFGTRLEQRAAREGARQAQGAC